MYSVEYGSKTQRPHFHAILFGVDFKNQKFLKSTKKNFPIFTSEELQKLWPYGHSSIGSATPESAYYIASYALKRYTQVHPETGEVLKDFMRTSKRPAIGYNYLIKHYKQLVDSKIKLPRYYLKKLLDIDHGYLQIYENRKDYQKPKDNSGREKYARFKIKESKHKTMHYRSNELDYFSDLQDKYVENYLNKNKGEL